VDRVPLHVVDDGRFTSYESGSAIAISNDCTPEYFIMSTERYMELMNTLTFK
jgi:hypothetical protein